MEALNGDSRSLVVVETYFADLGFTDAAERQAKRRLAYALNQLLEARKLSEADAAKMVGVTEAKVTMTNRDKSAVPTPVAIVGIPGGLEVRHDRLKELVKMKRIDAYEVIGREVVLYWRTLDAGQTADVSLSLVAAVPGTYTAPASRAYLYYTDEFKQWVPGVGVTITPKE